MSNLWILIGAVGLLALSLGCVVLLSQNHTLDGIKSKTVGDGQHGTARWAARQEISRSYTFVPFTPEAWRRGRISPKNRDWCWAARDLKTG